MLLTHRNIYIAGSLLLMAITTAFDMDSVFYPGKDTNLLESNEYLSIPKIRRRYSRTEKKTYFTGNYSGSFFTSYESDQSNSVESDSQLAWETTSTRSGKRIATYVNIKKQKSKKYANFTEHYRLKRIRRNVYGRDDRSFIPITGKFGLKKPYIYTVKISTGCTGIVVSPRHILTAAHCVHDQKDYVAETKGMKVGFLKEGNKIEWVPVKSIKVSKGWIEGGKSNGPTYDYALLRLTRKHTNPYIKLTVSEADHHGVGERIYFTAFDDDKPENTMWHRSCSVVEDDPNFLYHYCDAKPGSSGSGVYSWVYDNVIGEWRRELVGVFSGNRWRIYDDFYVVVRNFNVAVRLTARKYAQVCKWMGKMGKSVCKYHE